VDFGYLARVTRLNVGGLCAIGLAATPPAEVELRTEQLVHSSTLDWTASPDGGAAAYKASYRDSTSSVWEQIIPAGARFQVTLPYSNSKDNGVFAVRVYDADGHSHSPVNPTAER